MQLINLTGRFLLELAAIGAVGFWGSQAFDSLPARIVVAIGAATVFVTFWALVVAPKANNAIPADIRVLIGSGVLLLAAGALALAGQPTLGLVLAAAVIVNTALLFVLGHDMPATFARSA
jgi:hypothetical protein